MATVKFSMSSGSRRLDTANIVRKTVYHQICLSLVLYDLINIPAIWRMRMNKKPSCCWDGRPYCPIADDLCTSCGTFSNANTQRVTVRIRISVRVRVNPVQITARYSHSSPRRNIKCHRQTDNPVGDWISAPMPNVVAMATRVGPKTFCMVSLSRPSPKTPWWVQTYVVYVPYKSIYSRF